MALKSSSNVVGGQVQVQGQGGGGDTTKSTSSNQTQTSVSDKSQILRAHSSINLGVSSLPRGITIDSNITGKLGSKEEDAAVTTHSTLSTKITIKELSVSIINLINRVVSILRNLI